MFRNSLKKLPNLHDVENAVSTHRHERIANAYEQLYERTGLDLDACHPEEGFSLSGSFRPAIRLTLGSLTTNITSLKLRGVLFVKEAHNIKIPHQIEHLDLEFYTTGTDGVLSGVIDPVHAPRAWRKHLGHLRELKTLRLGQAYSTIPGPHSATLYFDDLLTYEPIGAIHLLNLVSNIKLRKSRKEDSTEVDGKYERYRPFPKLESLALVNCPVRNNGLLFICAVNRKTLKKLELQRVVLDAASRPKNVAELAKLAREFAPNLEHQRFSRVLFHSKNWSLRPWDRGEEAVSVYSWNKEDNSHALNRRRWDVNRMFG